MIASQKVSEIISQIMKERVEDEGEIISVDGKAIRSTGSKENLWTALQILTAYATESGIVLGQEKIHKKTNKIPVFKKCLTI